MIHRMKRLLFPVWSWIRNIVLLVSLSWVSAASAEDVAIQLDFEGALGVATAEYLIDGINEANERDARLIIIRMDTPGGLMGPMRDIIQAILASDVPVATYVSPGGARADSAGTFILLASHIAAMAPTTHMGAATPVSLTGDGFGDPKPPAEEIEDLQDTPADEDTAEDEADGDEPADIGILYVSFLQRSCS